MNPMCTTTCPNTHQPPGNQQHLLKAIPHLALFCCPFLSRGHEQWWKTSAARGRLDATLPVPQFPGLQGDAVSIRQCSTALQGSRLYP